MALAQLGRKRGGAVIATSYPLFNFFLSLLWIALFVFWVFLAFHVILDIFRSHDMIGAVKALWVIGIILFPFIGVLLYLVVRGGSMHLRQIHAMQMHEAAYDEYVRKSKNMQ